MAAAETVLSARFAHKKRFGQQRLHEVLESRRITACDSLDGSWELETKFSFLERFLPLGDFEFILSLCRLSRNLAFFHSATECLDLRLNQKFWTKTSRSKQVSLKTNLSKFARSAKRSLPNSGVPL